MTDNLILTKLEELKALYSKPQEKEFMTMEEASNYLGLSKVTVYGYIWKKKLPYFKQGKKVYFETKDLRAFVLNQKNRISSNKELEEKADKHLLTSKKGGSL